VEEEEEARYVVNIRLVKMMTSPLLANSDESTSFKK